MENYNSHPNSQTRLTPYRAISLLPTLSKLAEKITNTKIQQFLSSHHIIPPFQFGFRPKHSITHQITRITTDAINNFKNKKTTTSRLKNKCLRLITNSNRYTKITTLHDKTNLPTIREFTDKLSNKFCRTSHPNSLIRAITATDRH